MPIHPTAIIDPAATIAPSADIGPNVVIDGPATIGDHVHIIATSYISGPTTIEPRCTIHPFTVIGNVPQDLAFEGGESFCTIGEESVIREFVSIHRGTAPGSSTTIGRRCYLMANSHVAHNCSLGDDVKLANCASLAGHTTVGSGAFFSAHCGVHQFCRIGTLAMIGGITKIVQDVPPYFLIDGNPARCRGINTVGLRRAGFSPQTIAEIKAAHRLLYRSSLARADALHAMREQLFSPQARELIRFLEQPTKRGIVGAANHRPEP